MPNNELFNLTETVLQVVEDARHQIIRENKNVDIIYDSMSLKTAEKEKDKGVIIEGDRERIAQVISNILDNAVRFVKDGAVTISIDTNSTITSDIDNVGNTLQKSP